jgi:23S rRNA pseudouridine2605 synthase
MNTKTPKKRPAYKPGQRSSTREPARTTRKVKTENKPWLSNDRTPARRGRPRKITDETQPPREKIPGRRGRPRKIVDGAQPPREKVPGRRGRPRKVVDDAQSFRDERRPKTADGPRTPYVRKPKDASRTPYVRKPKDASRMPRERKPLTEKAPYAGRVQRGEEPRPRARYAKAETKPAERRPEGPVRLTKEAARLKKAALSDISDETRLNKYISNSGICSRREADKYITAGVVSVNGTVVTEMGYRVKPGDDVRFNGERLKGETKVYIVMNKPKDCVTSTSDPHAEKTVMDLIGDRCAQRVFPVGRLDKNTTGVLLLTNDGELTERLTHPSYNKKKIYDVLLNRKVRVADLRKLVDGIELEDGLAQADQIEYVDAGKQEVGLEIHSGRNRVVRRMFEALGYHVQRLDRVYFAGLTKKNLRRGQWRFLTESEISALKMGAYE